MATVWGLAIVGFGFADDLVPAVLLLACGGADCVSGIFRMMLWNQTIPDSFRGPAGGDRSRRKRPWPPIPPS